jgi:hypothetical protein
MVLINQEFLSSRSGQHAVQSAAELVSEVPRADGLWFVDPSSPGPCQQCNPQGGATHNTISRCKMSGVHRLPILASSPVGRF